METKLKTPFRCNWSEHLCEWHIRDCDGHLAACFQTEAEAREAVGALNSHASLTSALDACVEALEQFVRYASNGHHAAWGKYLGTHAGSKMLAALEQAKKVRG